MKSGRFWLTSAGLLAAVLAVWCAVEFIHVAETGAHANDPAKAPVNSAAAFEHDYALAADEPIRRIGVPDPKARLELLDEWRLAPGPSSPPVVSITVELDTTPRVRSMQSGIEIVPRRLLNVLVDSLQIPPHRLEGLEVSRQIGLSGDWVVRSSANLDQCMTYVESAVRESGHPGFSITREVQNRKVYGMHGLANAPPHPIQIFPPHPEASMAHKQTGTMVAFGQALSAAIRQPVIVQVEREELVVAWRDNSRPYLDTGADISDEMISHLLDEVSDALGVSFAESEVVMPTWNLKLDH